MAALLTLMMLAQPLPSGYGLLELNHSSGLQLHLNDDAQLTFGNTAAAPDVWFDNNGTSFCLTSTNIDAGGGTDGDIFCNTLGTDDLFFGAGDLRLDGGKLILDTDDADTYIQQPLADQLYITVGGATIYIAEGADDYLQLPDGMRIKTASGALNLGSDATADHSLTAGDVLIGGKLEVDDRVYFDTHTVTQYGTVGGTVKYLLAEGSSGAAEFAVYGGYDQGKIGIDAEAGYHLVLGKYDSKDYGHAAQTNPTLFIHSIEDPDTNNAEWIGVTHDQTNGLITTGQGILDLNPVDEGLGLPAYAGTDAPTEPVSCTAANAGVIAYADDTNDSAAAQLCICAATTDDGGGTPTMDWLQMHDMTTACGFF